MRIIRWSELQVVPWKNGQGITREIAKEPKGESFVWRLSIADVAGDGPFSRFDGMRRILTVVEGEGMELMGTSGALQADLGVPVAFDGALNITSRLKDGPVRDLNLIFDPQLCNGRVSALLNGEAHSLHCGGRQFLALHCLSGSVALNNSGQLNKGDTALLDQGTCDVRIEATSQALLVKIERLN
jgi:environmental stress-induced protein Ves